MTRYALVLRGPNGAGKTATATAIGTQWRGGMIHRVALDHGWGNGDRESNWRPTTQGKDRYRDLLEPAARQADLLVIELGLGEPSAGGHGATTNPREWIDLLHDRAFLYFRLSVSLEAMEKRLIERKLRLRIPGTVRDSERVPHRRVELNAHGDLFPARARLKEHVLFLDNISYDEAARVVLDRLPAAEPSP